jgi:hypothetical protein
MASLVVIECIRVHADAFILPMYKVLGGYMIPVFQAMYRSPRAPLIEQMPGSVIFGKSVRVTGKACHRLNMIFLSVVGSLNTIIQILNFISALQNSVALFECPLLHF